MTATTKLALELLQNAAANQTLANLTFAQLNQLVQASVLDKDLAAPPASPANEALYIVSASPTGAWAGRAGQLAYWLTTAGAWTFIQPTPGWQVAVLDEIDSTGLPLRYSFNGSAWSLSDAAGAGIVNPMTTIRDMIVAGVGGAPSRLPGPTAEGMVLTRIGNALAWAIATGFANPMTAAGDLIVGATAGAASRLGIGTAGQVLTVVSGALAWVNPTGAGSLPLAGGTMTGPINEATIARFNLTGSTVNAASASANTIQVDAAGGSSITSFGPAPGSGVRRWVTLGFDGISVVHSSDLIIPGGQNIAGKAGDAIHILSLSTTTWKVLDYVKADGTPLVTPSDPNKVDKVAGLQLSQESYTTVEKAKLGGVAAGATANANTDSLSEGATNLYFTAARVRAAILTGLSLAVGGAIAATDSVLSAMGRLQYQISNLTKANVGLDQADNTSDANKPVSGPQQTAFNLKLNAANPSATGNLTVAGAASVGAGFTLGGSVVAQANSGLSFTMRSFLDNFGVTEVILSKGRGTIAAPTPLIATDRLGQFVFGGVREAGQAAANAASLSVYAASDHSSTNQATYMNLENTTTGNVSRGIALTINESNNILMGVGRGAASGSKLDVGGAVKATGPIFLGQYTLTTIPSVTTYNGYYVTITNATGGPKLCYLNGTACVIANTTTPVS